MSTGNNRAREVFALTKKSKVFLIIAVIIGMACLAIAGNHIYAEYAARDKAQAAASAESSAAEPASETSPAEPAPAGRDTGAQTP